MNKHRLHENKECMMKEATEHIKDVSKVPHSKDTYGKMPSMHKVPKNY